MLLVELHMQNPPGRIVVSERACEEPELHIADCGCDSVSNISSSNNWFSMDIIKRLVQQQASIQFYIRLSFILSRCRRRTIDSRIKLARQFIQQ
ncbi:unnamed protein product [Rotaria magnacalcarata]|uniref:Uncharacterized protein n=1 Tax=Rotaria magnacalcarata TaxID=392030 RepID=A0A816T7H9_9BILA|nr:unnamed protein product [Rotaria magnacalcarata]